MPPNEQRRTQILDAAIDIVADDGLGALTHRRLDERASLPAGTTSNYFRTRLSLLQATAARTAELHWQYVELLKSVIGLPLDRERLAALLTRMVFEPNEQSRRRTIARFELFIEGTRRAELQPFLNDLQAAAMASAALMLGAAGLSATAEQTGELARLLNGLAFSTLTISPQRPGAADPAGVIHRLLSAVLPDQTALPGRQG